MPIDDSLLLVVGIRHSHKDKLGERRKRTQKSHQVWLECAFNELALLYHRYFEYLRMIIYTANLSILA